MMRLIALAMISSAIALPLAGDAGAQEFECKGWSFVYTKLRCRFVQQQPVISDYCKLTVARYNQLRQPIPRSALDHMPRVTLLGINGLLDDFESQCITPNAMKPTAKPTMPAIQKVIQKARQSTNFRSRFGVRRR